MSIGRLWYAIAGVSNSERRLGGYFTPAGTGAPTTVTQSGGKHAWSVSRIAAGRFLVKLVGSIGEIKNLRATVQIDPAGATQPLQAVIGPVSIGDRMFEIDVFNTTTGALTDIVQPVTPTNQGSYVHWHFSKSGGELRANTQE